MGGGGCGVVLLVSLSARQARHLRSMLFETLHSSPGATSSSMTPPPPRVNAAPSCQPTVGGGLSHSQAKNMRAMLQQALSSGGGARDDATHAKTK